MKLKKFLSFLSLTVYVQLRVGYPFIGGSGLLFDQLDRGPS